MAAEHPPEPAPTMATSYSLSSRANATSALAKKINVNKITMKTIVFFKDIPPELLHAVET